MGVLNAKKWARKKKGGSKRFSFSPSYLAQRPNGDRRGGRRKGMKNFKTAHCSQLGFGGGGRPLSACHLGRANEAPIQSPPTPACVPIPCQEEDRRDAFFVPAFRCHRSSPWRIMPRTQRLRWREKIFGYKLEAFMGGKAGNQVE